ncbi:MAG: hypothetical protein RBS38_06100 [Bacteroidales bacterium]|nr:hypothetical protein [Bacteroidales bacterium]
MEKFFLTGYPAPEEIRKKLSNNHLPQYREANGHIHTPYSFSSFPDMGTIFSMAKEEHIAVLGINDFFVADGFREFIDGSLRNKIFPLFNIEFIGLMKKEQKNGIRINDPNNPGRIYFSGKGLDYPFKPGFLNGLKLKSVVRESQNQIKAMISKLNGLIEPVNPSLALSYDKIKARHARDLVRERHLALALRTAVTETYPDPGDQLKFIEKIYGGKKSKADPANPAQLENEIRSNLLKSGGAAFVREDENSFLELPALVKIILKAGGIPCYPVLLDDSSGNYTEFEKDWEKLHKSLNDKRISCIELIPGRNSLPVLSDFVHFFHDRNYIVTFGTEHNTPDLLPLTVTAKGQEPLSNDLKQIAWDGVCVIAAHQYLRAKGMQGYVMPDGKPNFDQKRELTYLGRLVVEFFLSKN